MQEEVLRGGGAQAGVLGLIITVAQIRPCQLEVELAQQKGLCG